jgi:hypothetical protein
MNPEQLIEGLYNTPIYYKDVATYITNDFFDAMYAWRETKRWNKFAYEGGWMEQPINYMDAIDAIEDVYNEIESEEMEKRMKESKK